MTTLLQQIEDMRVHVNDLANAEQGLVKALGDALNRADQKLLHDVRSVAAEHELRRGTILKELQSLASNIGLLPAPRESMAMLESAPREVSAFPIQEEQQAIRRGDWRQAANNIQDELDFHLNGRTH
ncbi:MAG: hypothetical protein HC868_04460 [Sphingomonadales bacterium]|nr:hypothetical protein [Sphingomonadales bacterium]